MNGLNVNGFLGVRALARKLGVSHSAIIKAVKEGRLTPAAVTPEGPKFDFDAARTEWKPNIQLTVDDNSDGGADGDDGARYRKARADKEEALAAQEVLELGRLEKELLRATEVGAVWSQLLGAFSDKLSGIPQKLFSRFPGTTEEGREFLRSELRLALDDLSEWKPQ